VGDDLGQRPEVAAQVERPERGSEGARDAGPRRLSDARGTGGSGARPSGRAGAGVGLAILSQGFGLGVELGGAERVGEGRAVAATGGGAIGSFGSGHDASSA
jgi:hypothetical protein